MLDNGTKLIRTITIKLSVEKKFVRCFGVSGRWGEKKNTLYT